MIDKKNYIFIFCVSLLFIMGLVMVFNTTSAEILDGSVDRDIHYALIRQALYAIVGFLCALGVWFIGYRTLLRLSGFLLFFFTVLLVLALIPGVGSQINGARRWINIFGNSFQPSEFVKYIIPMYCIHRISLLKCDIDFGFFLKLMSIVCIPMGLILIEPDNGTVFIIGVTMVFFCIVSRIRWQFWLLPILALAVIGGSAALKMQHVPDRIRVFMNPESDLLGKGHQPHQAKIAAGSGGLLGKGFGESLQKMSYLPEARSDYIAAIFAEEFGFIGVSLMIIVYMVMGFIGYLIAISCKDLPAFYLASVFVFLLSFQAFFNLGVVSGLLPSKGTSLPFFSQGGSSLLANFLSVSVILNIAKESEKKHARGI